MIDFRKVASLQISLMEDLDNFGLSSFDKIKFGRILVGNYKKAKQIIKSKVRVEGDWEGVLETSKVGLENLVEKIQADIYAADELPPSAIIGYVELLSQIQFLNFAEETQYKYVDSSAEDEIDMSIYEDLDI